jgi:hypothetical protein
MQARAATTAVRVVIAARLTPGRARRWRPDAPPYRKVFVVGSPRSGTTWVQKLLQAHPAVIGTEESHALGRLTAACARPRLPALTRLFYGYHRDVALGRAVGLHNYVTAPELRRLAAAALASDGTTPVDAFVRSVFDRYFLDAGGTSDHVFVEKTPMHVKRAPQLLDLFPEAQIVEVVRDGRDVMVSMQQLDSDLSWVPATAFHQARKWTRAVGAGLALRGRPDHGTRITTVRYEDLKEDGERELGRLFAFLGLDAPPSGIAAIVGSLDFDEAKRQGAGHFLRRGEVGDWAHGLSPEDLATFREVAEDVFHDAGYRFGDEVEGEPRPELSVVIPTRNRVASVASTIGAVLEQEGITFEVVVVDDGSTDGTAEGLAEIACREPRLRVVREEHGGVGAARNAGMRAAVGRLIVFLDDDDTPEEGWLAGLGEPLAAAAVGLASCACHVDRPGRTDRIQAPLRYPLVDEMALFIAGCYAFRRDLFVDSGGFDTEIVHGENSEFGFRLVQACRARGLRTAIVDRPLITVHRDFDRTRGRAKLESVERVIDRNAALFAARPRSRSKWAAVAAVDGARDGNFAAARRVLVGSIRRDPMYVRNIARLAVLCLPPLAGRIWAPRPEPVEPAGERSLAEQP